MWVRDENKVKNGSETSVGKNLCRESDALMQAHLKKHRFQNTAGGIAAVRYGSIKEIWHMVLGSILSRDTGFFLFDYHCLAGVL